MIAIPLAVCAALCNALTTIFQRLGVETAPDAHGRGLKLIRHVLRRPIWYVGFAAMLGSFLLQATALGFGSLSVVQPLMVTELIFLVVILRVWFGSPLGWSEAIGTVLTVAGLAAFLAMSNTGGGTTFPTTSGWVIVITVCCAAIAICSACTRLRSRKSRSWRSAWFGSAAAISFALSASFTKATTILFSKGFWQIFEHWEPYAIVVGGLAGLVLTQDAFHAGPITASQATLTIVDPIVSVVIGVGLFDDDLRGGIGALAFDAAALLVMCVGLFVLTQSPLMAGSVAQEHLGRSRLEHTRRKDREVSRSGR
ncbi:MAG: DMT family transporter [Acidimicrobiales bacterium]